MKRGYPAFTLVELLVVIAITAVLMAMLVPSPMRAKAKAADSHGKSLYRNEAIPNGGPTPAAVGSSEMRLGSGVHPCEPKDNPWIEQTWQHCTSP